MRSNLTVEDIEVLVKDFSNQILELAIELSEKKAELAKSLRENDFLSLEIKQLKTQLEYWQGQAALYRPIDLHEEIKIERELKRIK